MQMHNLKLYGHYDSGHVYKVRLFLELARIPYEYEYVDIWIDSKKRQAEFLKNSLHGEVPCLLIDGQSYIQSNLILYKLASVYQIYAGESEQRLAQALQWLFWEANRLGMCLPQLRYAKRFAAHEFNSESLNFLRSRFNHDIEVLAKQLDKGQKFIFDNQPSIADFSICGYLYWADEAEVELPAPVKAWLARISDLDGYELPYVMMKSSQSC